MWQGPLWKHYDAGMDSYVEMVVEIGGARDTEARELRQKQGSSRLLLGRRDRRWRTRR